MAPTRKRGSKISTPIARKEWNVGELVMAKVKGFPAWPAQVSRAEDFDQTPNPSRVFVYFFGTRQIRFCQHAEISQFTPDVRAALTTKCQSKGTIADLRLAFKEICEIDDEIRAAQSKQEYNVSNEGGDESSHHSQSSLENRELPNHSDVNEKPGIDESNMEEEILTPIIKQEKDNRGAVCASQGRSRAKVLDGTKSGKRGKDRKSGSICRVSKQEIKDMRRDFVSPTDESKDRDAVAGTIREAMGKFATTEIGTKSFQSTDSIDGYKDVVNLEKDEPAVQTGKDVLYRDDDGILGTKLIHGQRKKIKSRKRVPPNDQVDSSLKSPGKCVGTVETITQIKADEGHDGHQKIITSTDISTGLIQVGNVSTNFAAHDGLEAGDFEYTDNDDKGARKDFTSRMHHILPPEQNAEKPLDITSSSLVKHKGNDQIKSSGEMSVYGEEKRLIDNQNILQDEDAKLEKQNLDDSINFEGCAPNKNKREPCAKATDDVDLGKEKIFPKRRKLVDSQETAKSELTATVNEMKTAGDLSDAQISEKSKKVVRDSDEHLPLVKRARARGHGEYIKSVSEDQSPVMSHELVKRARARGHGEYIKSVSEDQSPVMSHETQVIQDEGVEFSEKVRLKRDTALLNDAVAAEEKLLHFEGGNVKVEETGQGSLPWKADKPQVRSSLIDGEAALPPSKRRQRALEAMTACVAEAASIEMDKVKGGGREADNLQRSSPVKQSASSDHIASKDVTSISKEAVYAFSPPFRKTAGVQQNKDDVKVERLFKESTLKVETCPGLHNFDIATERKPVVGQGNSMSHTLLKVQESGDASKVRSPKLEGRTKAKNPNVISKSVRLETVPNAKAPDTIIRETAITSASRPVVANTQPKFFVSQAKPFSLTCQGVGRSDGESPNVQLEEKDKNVREVYEAAKEVKQRMNLKEKDSSLLSTSMKYLIAAAQAKRPVRSQGAADLASQVPEKLPIILAPSPSSRYGREYVKLDSPIQQHAGYHQVETLPRNGGGACLESHKVDVVADKHDIQTLNRHADCHGDASQSVHANQEQEAAIARDALEGMLETLSRTRDSIGRVTRHAIDCAKLGIAEQVVEVIVRKLEDEHSFRRRVDLFFLLDSVTQCSVREKGIAGATYPPAVQAALPRLLKAAAPPGNSARENRRQCLKVLNLWLERNVLPAQVIRQSMNGIEAHDTDKCLSLGARPSRNERAIDDPLREMEGIVDEYGSNAGYALPGFFVPRIFDDDDEGNECVQKTSESAFEIASHDELGNSKDEKTQQSMNDGSISEPKSSIEASRHRHFLEDVDGELEMEDVSPIADKLRPQGEQMEGNILWRTAVEVAVSSAELMSDPPLPSAVPPSPICPPPSPPPLPVSPPPSPPPPPFSPPPISVVQPPVADTDFLNNQFIVASVPSLQGFSTLPVFSSFEQVRSAESFPSRFGTPSGHYSQQHLVPGVMQPSIDSIRKTVSLDVTLNSPPNFVVPQMPPPNFTLQMSSSYTPTSEPQKPLTSKKPLVQTLQSENVNILQQRYVFPRLPLSQLQGKAPTVIGEVPYVVQQPWSAVLPSPGPEKEHILMPRVQDQQWGIVRQEHAREIVQDQVYYSEYASQGMVLNATLSKSNMIEGEKVAGGFHPVAYQPSGSNSYPPELVNGFTGSRQGQTFPSVLPGQSFPTATGSVSWVPYAGSNYMEPMLSQNAGLTGVPAEKSVPALQVQLQLPGFRASIPSSNLWRPL